MGSPIHHPEGKPEMEATKPTETCTACSGTGWYYSTPWPEYHKVTCKVCEGTGQVKP